MGVVNMFFGASVIGLFILRICAISTNELIQNTITEEERRGATVSDNKNKDNHKGELEKHNRGVYAASGTQKHQQYYFPSVYDSQVASTGHGGGGADAGVGSYGGSTGSGYSGYPSHSSGHSIGGQQHGSTGFGGGTGYGYGYSSGHGSSSLGHGGHGSSIGYGGHGSTGHGSTGHGSIGHGSTGHGHSGNGDLFGHGGGYGGGHGGGHGGYNSAIALKGLLIPLAGIALIGAAAALATNPVLLQLGVLSGRRKRSLSEEYSSHYPVNPYVTPDHM